LGSVLKKSLIEARGITWLEEDLLYNRVDIKKTLRLVVLCLGSMQVSGDSLGPRVGNRLRQELPHLPVYGTQQNPLDSRNMHREIQRIQGEHPGSVWLAVDAAQGNRSAVGQVTLRKGPLIPGIGLGYILPAVGDVSITAVVRPRPNRLLDFFSDRTDSEEWAQVLAQAIAEGIEFALSQ
jgi:putative sporulation protein YyaC